MKRFCALLTALLLLTLPALAESLPPTPVPDAQTDADTAAALTVVDDFFYFWRVGSVETLLLLTAPSWRAAQADPQSALSAICEGWYPADHAEILSISGSSDDVLRTVRAKVSMQPDNAAGTYVFTVYVQKEDSEWYVNPQSVARHTAPSATPAPAARAATPTPMPAPQSAPGDTPLYYNPDGGSKYHADPNCGAVSARYLPMTGVFTYSQLNEASYADLKPCAYCAAPLPPAAPTATATPVYVDDMLTEGYVRDEPIRMPGADEYKTVDFAVGAWRDDSFHTNAAAGSLAQAPGTLEEVWHITLPASDGLLFTEDIQPAIVQWPREIRSLLQIDQEHKATAALKEVFLPTLDGSIHCLSLADGTQTRSPIRIGYPMTGSVTLHPLGYPTLIAGQLSALRAHGMGHIGMRYISALDGVTDRFVADRASTAFATSALIDRNTNTAVFLSSGGWLFTEKLDAWLTMNPDGQLDTYRFYTPQSVSARVSATTVTAAPVMHENLLWLGNNAGQVICVDTTTMQPLWTTDVGSFVSSLAMRETADGLQLLAVTGLGEAHLVCLDPYTGSVTEDILLTLSAPGPCAASAPVVGQEGLDGLVFVNLTGTSDATAGLSELCAIDMGIVAISWRVGYPDSDALSAPVAVYDDEGNGFLITAMACGEGTVLILLEGQTGVIRATLTLEGANPCSPAVFGDTLVIATNTEGSGHVYGIRLAPENAPTSSKALADAFMTAWAANDLKAMLDLCAPSWVAAQDNASVMLFAYRANRTPTAWECTASDDGVVLRICLDRNNGRAPEWYTGNVAITEEDGQQWIDPSFLPGLVPEQ